MASSNVQIDKLTGRDNYNSWKFAVKTYLQHEDLWTCIEPDKVGPIDIESTDKNNLANRSDQLCPCGGCHNGQRGNDGYNSRTKHIDVRHHYVREKLLDKKIEVRYVYTGKMVADVLTKATPQSKLSYFANKMGLCSREDVEN